MAAPNPLIPVSTAAASNQVYDAHDADKVLFALTGTYAGAEAVTFFIQNSANSRTPVYNAAGTQVTLNSTLQSVMLEGGFLYGFDKTATAAAAGLDVSVKPRIAKP